jgi:hypothetical protein
MTPRPYFFFANYLNHAQSHLTTPQQDTHTLNPKPNHNELSLKTLLTSTKA